MPLNINPRPVAPTSFSTPTPGPASASATSPTSVLSAQASAASPTSAPALSTQAVALPTPVSTEVPHAPRNSVTAELWLQRAEAAQKRGAYLPPLPHGKVVIETLQLAFAQLDPEARSELRERCVQALRDDEKIQMLHEVLVHPDTPLAKCAHKTLQTWLIAHFDQVQHNDAFLTLPVDSPVHAEVQRFTYNVVLRGGRSAFGTPGVLETALMTHWVRHAPGRLPVYIGLEYATSADSEYLDVVPLLRELCRKMSHSKTLSADLQAWLKAHGDAKVWDHVAGGLILEEEPNVLAPLVAQAMAAGDDYVVNTLPMLTLGDDKARKKLLALARDTPSRADAGQARYSHCFETAGESRDALDELDWRTRSSLSDEEKTFWRACIGQDVAAVQRGLTQKAFASLVRDGKAASWPALLEAVVQAPATLQAMLESIPVAERSAWVRRNAGVLSHAWGDTIAKLVPYLEGEPAALHLLCGEVLEAALQHAGFAGGFVEIMEHASDAQRASLMDALQLLLAGKPSPYATVYIHASSGKVATVMRTPAVVVNSAQAGRGVVPTPSQATEIDWRALEEAAVSGTRETGMWVPAALAPSGWVLSQAKPQPLQVGEKKRVASRDSAHGER